METTEEPAKGLATCGCGAEYEYDSIPFGSGDLGLSLAPRCGRCQAAFEADERQAAKAREREANRARVMEILPPELLPVWLDPLGTDPDHSDFNRAKWEVVRKWRPGPHGNGLGLIGSAGSCKTRILALLAEKIVMQGVRVFWTSAMRLHTEAAVNRRSRERRQSIGAIEHFQDCMSAPYLVIDDLGNNEWCPAFESQLFTILDHRKNHRLPVLWSSNAHPEKFHLSITSVNPAALIGRLLDRTNTVDFDESSLL